MRLGQGSASLPSGAGTVAASLATSVLLLAGCGASGRSGRSARSARAAPPSVCVAAAREVIAGELGASPSAVTGTVATGNNSMPECHFAVRLGDGRRVGVVANVDTAPQPYQRLERTIVEAGQQFGVSRGFTPPEHVAGLGLDASWFPDQTKLMTTDGARLVSVVISWRAVSQARRRALAGALARPYLGKLQPQAADPTGS